ncbi:MAG: methyltransferase domain-containing protein [Anaerolineales bacterium]|nr:methyltransferase domain-containing protein [Anaerolineales bacterium]
MGNENQFYLFSPVAIEVKDLRSEGWILDIGGGGEGVIGRLKSRDVVAIDCRRDELEEAAVGPLKIVMDARDLQFLDNTFSTATAFFSLMYLKTREDQQKVLHEVWRVLQPGGYLHVWDVDLSERPETDKEVYVVQLRYTVGGVKKETGYGSQWPEEKRGIDYYVKLAELVGFRHVQTETNSHTFYLLFRKEAQADTLSNP